MDYKKELEQIREDLRTYLTKTGIRTLVLGQSGGIDSALVSAIVYPLIEELNLEFITCSITIETNKDSEILRAKNMGENFSTIFLDKDYTKQYKYMLSMLEDDFAPMMESLFEQKLRLGNAKARMRMMKLYDLAKKYKGIVLGTENKTEYLTGFFSIGGDNISDYEMIYNYFKTDIFGLTQYIIDNEDLTSEQKSALQACNNANPTDGLGLTENGDLDQLGAESYKEVDDALKSFLKDGTILNQNVIDRHKRSEYKRHLPIIANEGFDWMD